MKKEETVKLIRKRPGSLRPSTTCSPLQVMGSNISTSELMESIQRQSAESQVSKEGTPEDFDKNKEGASHYALNKERTVFQEKPEPCPLSSSLYYGGLEDMYVQSSNGQSYSGFKKDGKDDDQYGNNSHSASRGNWWQGSLYY
ncbi:hypothetical protein ACH5RR_010131 [Cinchona calisaya]|uniref:Uncharacterized protein n=1 Tax=Cinchona calisaya TaxID=153742 RepID=A0ABD3AHJ7_9GENT